jgi:hypothetical protein
MLSHSGEAFQSLSSQSEVRRPFGGHPLWHRIRDGRLVTRISGCNISHPEIFSRFGAAVGAARDDMVDGEPLPATAALIERIARTRYWCVAKL